MSRFLWQITRPIINEFQQISDYWPDNFCFITGAPRSGTTAVCEWLYPQKNMAVFTESRILIAAHRFLEEGFRSAKLKRHEDLIISKMQHVVRDFYRSQRILFGKDLVVDKEPLEPIPLPDKSYVKFLENLHILIPNVKLLFMLRDPIQTIWSMTQRKWGYSLTNFEVQSFTLDEYIENWCTNGEIILEYMDRPNAYVCQFGRLISDPEYESQRIYSFLNVRNGEYFLPRKTKETGFSTDQIRYIQENTITVRNKLLERGFSEFQIK